MARFRPTPMPLPAVSRQPVRLHFGPNDRIILDGVEWRCRSTDEVGHLLRAAHDPKVVEGISHDEMALRCAAPDFRHDRDWYSEGNVKARMHSGLVLLRDLPPQDREKIMWRRDFALEFLKYEKEHPKTRGDEKMRVAIAAVSRVLKERANEVTDAGRRRRAGRVKVTFDPPGPKRLLQWVNGLVAADLNPLELRDRYDRCGNRALRWTPVEYEVLARTADRYCSLEKPTIASLHGDMRAEIRATNAKRKAKNLPPLRTPSYDVLRELIADLPEFDVMAGRDGIQSALRFFRPVGEGLEDIARPMQEVEMDHWTVSLQTLCVWSGVWDELPKKLQKEVERARMTLGVIVCRRTRCILAMRLTRTASVESVIALIEMAVTDKKDFADGVGALTPWDMHGTMDAAYSDGGPAFSNYIVKSLFEDLTVDYEIPPGGLPHLRGIVERIFRTVHTKLVARFAGRTFENVVAKGDYDSEGRAGITVDELGYVLIRWVVDIYHNLPHPALGHETPRECFLRLTKEEGIRRSPDPHKRRHVFGIELDRVLGPAGLRFLGIQYRSALLHEHFKDVRNAKVIIRVDDGDLGAISAKIGDQWLTVPGPKKFSRVTAETWIAAEADLRRRGAHMRDLIEEAVVDKALRSIAGIASHGRKRVDISDTHITKEQLLAAEQNMKVCVTYPDDSAAEAVSDPGDIYRDAITVGKPATSPEAAASGPVDAPKSDRRRNGAPKAPARPKSGKKSWIIEDLS